MRTSNRFLTTMLMSAAVVGILNANAGAVRAVPSTHKLYVNNQLVDVAAYNIEGNNYFKLRDIAKLVNFGVQYSPSNGAVNLIPGMDYYPEADEGAKTTTLDNAEAKLVSPLILINANYLQTALNDETFQPAVYNINGNNYFKLRDLGRMINFNVTFTAATSRVDILTNQIYMPDFSQIPQDQLLREVSNNPGYFYDISLLTIPAKVNTLPDLEKRLRNWELYMINRINEERRNAGVNELVIDEELRGFSQYWAKHMADTGDFSHSTVDDGREYAVAAGLSKLKPSEINGVDDLTDKKIFDKVVNVGENIAGGGVLEGSNPAEELMQALLNSPGHKAEILYSDNKTVGVGFAATDDGKVRCCQNFGLVLYED